MSIISITKRIALPLMGLLLGACETATDLPEPPHTPQVALLYSLSNQDTAQIDDQILRQRQLYVSTSQRVFDTRYPEGRADATVEVLDAAGTVVERFAPAGTSYNGRSRYQLGAGYYVPTLGLVGQPGATYTLRAAVPGLALATSTVQLPAVPVIKSVTLTPRPPANGEARARLALTLADDPAATNYYVVYAQLLDAQGQRVGYYSYLNSRDNDDTGLGFGVADFRLSYPDAHSGYGFEPYPDTNVNGQEFTLSTNIAYSDVSNYYCPDPTYCPPPPAHLEVRVSSLSPATYRFYQSRRQYDENDGNPFAEPTSLISNISPGYGLFGGVTDAVYRLKL